MKKSKIIIAISIVVAIGIGVLLYLYYLDTNYFKTQDAMVSADTVTITPLITGSVSNWNVKEGDLVKKGQILGRQDLSSILSNSAMGGSPDAIMSKADIKSPIDGKIVQSSVVQGETISPGMQIAIVADTSHMYIKANIEETNINKIKQGQKVDITIDAYRGRHFTGTVTNIGQASQSAFSTTPSLNTSGTFSKVTQLIPVKISIENPENVPFILGMNTTINVHIGK